MTEKIKTEKVLLVVAFILLLGFSLSFIPRTGHAMDMDEMRDEYIELKNNIISSQMPNGNYRCCLEKPCTYCIEKDPKHGKGAKCSCLEDVVNGVHPCGECIGEILEGHGNPYLVEYFPEAIAEEIGEQHLNTLKQIIDEKYETYSINEA